MNTSLISELPRALIMLIHKAHSKVGGDGGNFAGTRVLQLSAEQRAQTVNWLRQVLLDFEALDQHIGLLEELYGIPFRYSRPRRYCLPAMDIPDSESTLPTTFLDCERLPDVQVTAILNEGIECFQAKKDSELQQLLLNPVALFDLFDVIDELQPDRWLEEMTQLGNAMYPQAGVSPIRSGTVQSTQIRSETADEGVSGLFDRHLSAAVSPPRPLSPIALEDHIVSQNRNENWTISSAKGLWPLVTVTLACAASVAALWVSFQARNTNRDIESQLALLRTSSEQDTVVLHSARGDSLTLANLEKRGILMLPAEDALRTIKKVGTPELRALVEIFEAERAPSSEIIHRLHKVLEMSPATHDE